MNQIKYESRRVSICLSAVSSKPLSSPLRPSPEPPIPFLSCVPQTQEYCLLANSSRSPWSLTYSNSFFLARFMACRRPGSSCLALCAIATPPFPFALSSWSPIPPTNLHDSTDTTMALKRINKVCLLSVHYSMGGEGGQGSPEREA